ncbi:translational machinery protein [Lichenihabitans psoromatis]|uniref:translational machinery protein n=1 Tax=Lichenihabitans psoromatis TaxID=2528642 RepID=UPI0010369E6C|nr:translational machinery protein [Lichenihabitans psoromatis]
MYTMHDTPEHNNGGAAATPHFHAVVWLDHHDAKIIHFNLTASDEEVVKPGDIPLHLHIKAGSASGKHGTSEKGFNRDIATAIGGAQAVLIIGPSTAKTEFIHHLRRHAPQIAAHVAAVETSARLTDQQLLAEGRRFFVAADRMTPQIV